MKTELETDLISHLVSPVSVGDLLSSDVGRKFLAPYAEAASNIVEQVGTIEELRKPYRIIS